MYFFFHYSYIDLFPILFFKYIYIFLTIFSRWRTYRGGVSKSLPVGVSEGRGLYVMVRIYIYNNCTAILHWRRRPLPVKNGWRCHTTTVVGVCSFGGEGWGLVERAVACVDSEIWEVEVVF